MRCKKCVVLLILGLIFLSCSGNKALLSIKDIDMNKLDPNLKSKVKELISQKKEGEEITVTGKYETIDAEELKTKINEYGGSAGTVTASVFTATCSVKTIATLSNKDFIKYLELAKTMNLKGVGK